MTYRKSLLIKADRCGLTEEDLDELRKEIPGFNEDDAEATLNEMIEEDRVSIKTPNEGDEQIMHGVAMVWFKGHWIAKDLIDNISKAIDGSYWVLRTACFPLMLWEDYPEENIEIELYGSNLESCIYEISKFRKNFDYRLEAWKYAKKDEDGFLADGVALDDLLYDQEERWFEIIDLEMRLLKLKRKHDGVKDSLSKEDIETIQSKLNDDKWYLSTSRSVPILYYNKHPKLSIMIPLFGTSVKDCIFEIISYLDNFDIDRNAKGCLIENICLYVDEESGDAKKYKGQLYEFSLDCFILTDRLRDLGKNMEETNDEV